MAEKSPKQFTAAQRFWDAFKACVEANRAKIPLRVVECCQCGARYSPLLHALKIGRYAQKESDLTSQ